MTAELVVRVHDHEPATQGSFFGQCTVDRRHKAIVIADNKATKPWRKAIVEAASNAMLAASWIPLNEALAVEITFWLPRPKTVRRLFPSTRPDIDKLARSSLDGLADSGAITEDGRVVDLTVSKSTGEAGRRANVPRPLTHSLDYSEEGLAVNATLCDFCGKTIPETMRAGTRFCETQCRINWHLKQKRDARRPEGSPFTCEQCSGTIVRTAETGRFPRFCSRSCKLERARQQRASVRAQMACAFCGASLPPYAVRYCSTRCQRTADLRRKGHRPIQPVDVRLWTRVDKAGPRGCWIWTGGTIASGYGLITVDREKFVVHRYVWEVLVGPIPNGMQVDHLCRVRTCVNPEHLEPVTQQENLRRERVANAIGSDLVMSMTVEEFAAIVRSAP